MVVVPLTIVTSLCLVFTFVIFFVREQCARRFRSPESDSLLPLNEEVPVVVQRATIRENQSEGLNRP
ncbi:MAG TPA: hypothetical protein VFT72_12585 [Opitutaceae bacterium]|nr:hypothetical protein [Opitutaceae bacterium]